MGDCQTFGDGDDAGIVEEPVFIVGGGGCGEPAQSKDGFKLGVGHAGADFGEFKGGDGLGGGQLVAAHFGAGVKQSGGGCQEKEREHADPGGHGFSIGAAGGRMTAARLSDHLSGGATLDPQAKISHASLSENSVGDRMWTIPRGEVVNGEARRARRLSVAQGIAYSESGGDPGYHCGTRSGAELFHRSDRGGQVAGDRGAGDSGLLGLKAATDMLRKGAAEGRVAGVFHIESKNLREEIANCTDLPVAGEPELIIARRMYESGSGTVPRA